MKIFSTTTNCLMMVSTSLLLLSNGALADIKVNIRNCYDKELRVSTQNCDFSDYSRTHIPPGEMREVSCGDCIYGTTACWSQMFVKDGPDDYVGVTGPRPKFLYGGQTYSEGGVCGRRGLLDEEGKDEDAEEDHAPSSSTSNDSRLLGDDVRKLINNEMDELFLKLGKPEVVRGDSSTSSLKETLPSSSVVVENTNKLRGATIPN